MKTFFLIFITIFFTSCSIKQTVVEYKNFKIEAANIKKDKKTNENLLVLKPKISKTFNTKDMIYSIKPYSYEKYAKNRWSENPSFMLHDFFINSFENSKIFTQVYKNQTIKDNINRLKIDISELYHKYEKELSYSILRIKITYINTKGNIQQKIYNEKVLCQENSPYGFVKATNLAFTNIYTKVIKEFKL